MRPLKLKLEKVRINFRVASFMIPDEKSALFMKATTAAIHPRFMTADDDAMRRLPFNLHHHGMAETTFLQNLLPSAAPPTIN